MAGETRRFYARYYLLTVIAPAYISAAVFYGAAWLLMYLANPAGLSSTHFAFAAFCAVIILLYRLPGLLARLGFLLSGVTRATVATDTDGAAKLAGILPVKAVDNRPAPELTPHVVQLGPVPYLAVGGGPDDRLWISTHLLKQASAAQLHCLVAHEAGHIATAEPDRREWLLHASWLIALPLAVVLDPWPLLLAAAALLHTLAWLRLRLLQTLRTEAAADAWASAVIGRRKYAATLLEYHRWIAGNREPTGLFHRLDRIGYSAASIEAMRRQDPPENADSE